MSSGIYEDNLRHYATPSSPHEQASARKTTLNDYEALYLAEILHEWAEYDAEREELADVARGYVEKIRRDQSNSGGYRQVTLYVHTDTALEVLTSAMQEWEHNNMGSPTFHPSLLNRVYQQMADVLIEETEDE